MRKQLLLFLYIPRSYVRTNALKQTNVHVYKLTQMKYVYTNKMCAVTHIHTQTVTPLPDFKISRKACKHNTGIFFFCQLCVCVFACRLKGLEIIKIRA